MKRESREAEVESYPPVEKCIPQADLFTDLFEETGKLSELFLNKNVTFVPRMPSGKVDVADKLHNFNIYRDKAFDKEVKDMNKSIKTIQKKEKRECLGKWGRIKSDSNESSLRVFLLILFVWKFVCRQFARYASARPTANSRRFQFDLRRFIR
jgi:hypothetical protein